MVTCPHGKWLDSGHAQRSRRLPSRPRENCRQVDSPQSLVRCNEEVVMGKKTIQHHRRRLRSDLLILVLFDSGLGGCHRDHPISTAFQENREFRRRGNLSLIGVEGHPDSDGAEAGLNRPSQAVFNDFERAFGERPRVVTKP